jgi:hypothetical protein
LIKEGKNVIGIKGRGTMGPRGRKVALVDELSLPGLRRMPTPCPMMAHNNIPDQALFPFGQGIAVISLDVGEDIMGSHGCRLRIQAHKGAVGNDQSISSSLSLTCPRLGHIMEHRSNNDSQGMQAAMALLPLWQSIKGQMGNIHAVGKDGDAGITDAP